MAGASSHTVLRQVPMAWMLGRGTRVVHNAPRADEQDDDESLFIHVIASLPDVDQLLCPAADDEKENVM